MRLIFDIETDGLLDSLTQIHSLVLRDADTGALVGSYHDVEEDDGLLMPVHQGTVNGVDAGLEIIAKADEIIGHNILRFDIPAIQKLHPSWAPKGRVTDTLILARLWMSGDALRAYDAALPTGTVFGKHFGSHSLEAWGRRLGKLKQEYAEEFKENAGSAYQPGDEWREWSPEMQAYCEIDTEVTWELLRKIEAEGLDPQAAVLEHKVAAIIARQERRGFAFDVEAAHRLAEELQVEKARLEDELRNAFRPWWRAAGDFVPKRDDRRLGYSAGCPLTKVEYRVFEPNSRADYADRLRKVRGWEPKELTETGKPKVDEAVLSQLPWPEARLAGRYFLVQKRLGQIIAGEEAWLNHVRDGAIHGSVNTNGAHTGRMTHSRPNLAQVPSGKSPWGKECRALFVARPGYRLVGMDASALELRNLAGYMAGYDGGAYARVVLSSDDPEVKAAGNDLHSVNARALGLDPKKKYNIDGKTPTGRDIAKVWFYAFIYGAGNLKLGEILGVKGSQKHVAAAGARSREAFLKALPALGKLVKAVQDALSKRGYLRGLDGRRLHARSAHAALNTLLQSAGAVIMKKALVLLDEGLQARGLRPGVDYEFVANVHDEVQMEVTPEHAEAVGTFAAECVKLAGEAFKFKCPLAGNYAVGLSWADTH